MTKNSSIRPERLQSSDDLTFPRDYRLTQSVQFKRVFGKGTRYGNGIFMMRAAPSDAGWPRLGLAVSRKCSRLAVQRHRIKRVVRESFRHERSVLPPMDYVVMCAPGAAKLSNAELRLALRGLWKRSARQSGRTDRRARTPKDPRESGTIG